MIKHLWKSKGKSVCGLENLPKNQLRKNFLKINCKDCIDEIKQVAIEV